MKMFNKSILVALSALALATLTACGGGSDSGSDDGGTGGAAIIGTNGSVDVNSQGDFAVSMLSAVNAARATARSCGGVAYPAVPALTWNTLLTESSAWYANDMANKNYVSSTHDSSDGRTPYERMASTGYKSSFVTENVAAGPSSVSGAMNAWLNSAGHCSAIMTASAKEIGAAHVVKSGTTYTHYWVLQLGAP